MQRSPKSMIAKTDIKLKHEEQKPEINAFKFDLFMLSSNGWMVQLIAMNLK